MPGAAYGALRDRLPLLAVGRGLLYGAGVFVVMDEVVAPSLGVVSGPKGYPWEAHWRGLVGHLVLGAATDTVLDVMDDVLPDGHGARDSYAA